MKKRMNDLILLDIFPNWMTNGIFKVLTENHPVPWQEDIADGSILDLEYFGNNSGTKIISPMMHYLVIPEEHGIPEDNLKKLAKLIYIRYGLKWSKLWNTLSLEYNPISNYDMVETEHVDNTTVKDQIDNTRTGSIKNSTEYLGSETSSTDSSGTTTTTDARTAFNTTSMQDTNKSTNMLGSGSSAVDETTTTNFNNRKDDTTQTYNNYKDTTTKQFDADVDRMLTRSGNIGVTTSQQMIESERNLWNWQFFEHVFNDVDEVLTIPSFGEVNEEWYEIIKSNFILPVASETVLGGVKAVDKTDLMTEKVGISEDGTLFYSPSGTAPAVTSVNAQVGDVEITAADLGAVTGDMLGSVAFSDNYEDLMNKPTIPEPVAKSAFMTSPVGMDEDGKLWSEAGSGASGVSSVNGLTGDVTITASDINAVEVGTLATVATTGSYDDLNNLPTIPNINPVSKTENMTNAVGVDSSGKLWSAGGGSGTGAVSSVNGMTGDVTITAVDINAIEEGSLATVASTGSYLDLIDRPVYNPTSKTADMVRQVGVDNDGKLWAAGGEGSSGVTSVNGQTGDVELTIPQKGSVAEGNQGYATGDNVYTAQYVRAYGEYNGANVSAAQGTWTELLEITLPVPDKWYIVSFHATVYQLANNTGKFTVKILGASTASGASTPLVNSCYAPANAAGQVELNVILKPTEYDAKYKIYLHNNSSPSAARSVQFINARVVSVN